MRSAHAATAAVFLAALCAVAPAADEKSYDVHLDRPYKAGETFAISASDTARSSQKTDTPDGQSMRNSNFRRVIIEADARVEKVDEKNQPAAFSLTLKKLTLQNTLGGQSDDEALPKEILPPGTIITVTYSNQQPSFFSKDGKPLPEDAAAALRPTFAPMPMKDDVFGTPGKKKVGDTWPVSTQAMTVDRTDPQSIDPASMTGDVLFKAVRDIAGIPCAQFEASLTTKKIPGLDVEPKEASLVVMHGAAVPLDGAKPLVAGIAKTTLHVIVEQKPLGKGIVRATVDSETIHEFTWTPK